MRTHYALFGEEEACSKGVEQRALVAVSRLTTLNATIGNRYCWAATILLLNVDKVPGLVYRRGVIRVGAGPGVPDGICSGHEVLGVDPTGIGPHAS